MMLTLYKTRLRRKSKGRRTGREARRQLLTTAPGAICRHTHTHTMKDFASNLLTLVNVIRINAVHAVADYVFATCLGNLLRQKLGGFASCHLLFSVPRVRPRHRRSGSSDACSLLRVGGEIGKDVMEVLVVVPTRSQCTVTNRIRLTGPQLQ